MGHLYFADASGVLLRGCAPVSCRAARCLAIVCAVVSIVGLSDRTASASVFASGYVYPADNPFTPVDEGLPIDGNAIATFELPEHQTYFEGRHDDGTDPLDLGDDFNVNANIFVGRRPQTPVPPNTITSGTLTISAETALRYMNLVIGDGPLSHGTMHITGPAALFNNNFNIIPPNLPTNFASVNPRAAESSMDGLDGAAEGFDLIVGFEGTAQLVIDDGGRAEIHDAVIIGSEAGSTGSLTVDGFASFLGSGGFDAGGGSEIHTMIIGRRGTGEMRITNGGTVASEAAPTTGGGTAGPIGAVIGSDPFETTEPDPGGNGYVWVTGPTSKWIIGGSLQVGGFHDSTEGAGMGGDIEGDNVEYISEAGRGTLYVQDNAQVNIRAAIGADPMQDELLLAIGRFGIVDLAGGRITIGSPLPDDPRPDTIQVINDGTIRGSGRINTGVFRNRYYGQVQVRAGEKLTIDSSSEFSASGMDAEPMMNFGLIEVIGTVDSRAELEFIRDVGPPDEPGLRRPFLNRPLPLDPPPPDFDGGLISAQHATLRFGSGMQNEGVMAFTAGNNVITGRVDNVATDDNNGRFLVYPNTTVTVEDDFASGGLVDAMPVDFPILTIREGGLLNVLDHSSFTLQGHLDMEISFSNPAKIQVAGDVGLNGDLYLSFDNDTLGNLSHGDAFELIYFAGFIGGVDSTDPLNLRPDLTVNPVLNVVPDPVLATLYPDLDFITAEILQSYYLLVLDPSMVGMAGAVAPDFNGDGVVDLDDLAIWQANAGCEMGCSVLQGDADGDGDVDGDDLLFWSRNVGMPPPWSSPSVGGGGSLGPSVPEPTGLALLLSGSLLALACRRQRIAGQ